MSRLLALLIALLLPLQFVWGTAAASCQHETTPQAAAHFGHHAHVHQDDTLQPTGGKTLFDADCGACHGAVSLGGSPTLGGVPDLPRAVGWRSPYTVPVLSAHARAPDRPQWPRPA